jgi:hypothetical protein
MADYFKGVKNPYNFDLPLWKSQTSRMKPDWYNMFHHKYDPPTTLIHSSLNRLHDLTMQLNPHTHEWGSVLFHCIIFDLNTKSLERYEQLRNRNPTIFREPGDVNKDDLQGICKWIKGMCREILRKYRIPITSDSASDWLQTARLTTTDFRGLNELVFEIIHHI